MTRCSGKWLVFPAIVFIITVVAVLCRGHALGNRASETVDGHADEEADQLVVDTKYGQVRGTLKDGVRVFHGVPYARAPIGDLRLSPPLVPELWAGIRDATTLRPGCPQDCAIPLYCTNQTSEDCLFLEIYAPLNVTTGVPVMVYIHGGGFNDVTSTVAVFDSTNLVRRSGLVVVLIEYRIGTLGFLVTGSSEGDAKGNFGLQDQRLALVWVQENIRAFGGDPDQVTLVGQSAGAQSISIHLVSPESSPYFRSAILESAPLSLQYQTQEVAIKHGQKFAEILGCLANNSAIRLSCLRNKTVHEVLQAQQQAVKEDFSFFEKFEPWGPVVDGSIVTGQALTVLRTYAASSQDMKPIMVGYTSEEALLYVRAVLKSPISEFLHGFILSTVLSAIPEEVTKLYPVTNSNDTRDDLAVLFTDGFFRCPNRQWVQLLAAAAHSKKVWVYKWAKPIDIKLPDIYAFCGGRCCHGTQIPFVFQSFLQMFGEETAEDIVNSNQIIDLYSNFIRFGDPNGKGTLGYQKVTDPGHGADNTTGAALIYWPAVNGSQVGITTELLFAPDGHLEVTNPSNDQRCTAWENSNYSLSRK